MGKWRRRELSTELSKLHKVGDSFVWRSERQNIYSGLKAFKRRTFNNASDNEYSTLAIAPGLFRITREEPSMPDPDIHDFGDGNGPVKAHRHPHGGGWVADTAYADNTSYVGPQALVYGMARAVEHSMVVEHASMSGNAFACGESTLYGMARMRDNSIARNGAMVGGSTILSGNDIMDGNQLNPPVVEEKENVNDIV